MAFSTASDVIRRSQTAPKEEGIVMAATGVCQKSEGKIKD